MSTINLFQISLEIWGCLLCVIIAIVSGDKAYREGGAMQRIWLLMLLNGFLLISDAFAYVFRGEIGTFGICMTRISNFMVFALEGIMTWNVAACVEDLIRQEPGNVLKAPWMRVCSGLVLLQLLGLVITPLTGLYYFFDASNHYHRGIGIGLSFVILGIVCFLSAVKLFRHNREIPTEIIHIFRTSIPIFAVCFAVQFLEYGISLINVGLTVLLVMLFFGLWKESMRKENERQMNEIENLLKELMEAQHEQSK